LPRVLSNGLSGCSHRHSRAFDFDVDFARVGRTLLSDASDVDLVVDSDFDFDVDREGHGLSRAENDPPKSTRLQPLRVAALSPRKMVNVPFVPTLFTGLHPHLGDVIPNRAEAR
jgi:hypothetical protein